MTELLFLLAIHDFLLGVGVGIAAVYLLSVTMVLLLFLHEDEGVV